MPVAIDRAPRYFGVEQLSENIDQSPEGYLLCRNAVIGRTGYQKYRISELDDPDGILEGFSPDEEVMVYRDPSEVFSDGTLSSFEGKTFTLTHPDKLLNPTTDQAHNCGHIQNVRKGSDALDTGDWPMVADVIVKDAEAIRAIESGTRALSCGYFYKLYRDGKHLEQRNILGNHVALVLRGRAGSEARINDSAPPEKENPPVTLKSRLLQMFAKEAKPEEFDQALAELNGVGAARATVAPAGLVSVGFDHDGNELFARSKSTARDAEEKREVKNEEGKDAAEKAAMDRRKKMHDALDRQLDANESEESARSAEEDEDTEHVEGCRCEDCMDKAKDAESESEDAEIVRSEPVLSEEERPKSGFDAAEVRAIVADSNRELLNALKPIIAKTGNKKLISAFDTITTKSRRDAGKGGSGTGKYAEFRAAASKVNDEAVRTAKDSVSDKFEPRESLAEKQARENDSIYANAGKKSREAVRGIRK